MPVGIDYVLNSIETIKALMAEKLGITEFDFEEAYFIVADLNMQKMEARKGEILKINEGKINQANQRSKLIVPGRDIKN